MMDNYQYNKKNAKVVSIIWLMATTAGLLFAYYRKSKWYGYLGWSFLFGVIGSTGGNLFFPLWEPKKTEQAIENAQNVNAVKYKLDLQRKELKLPEYKLSGATANQSNGVTSNRTFDLKTPNLKLSDN